MLSAASIPRFPESVGKKAKLAGEAPWLGPCRVLLWIDPMDAWLMAALRGVFAAAGGEELADMVFYEGPHGCEL